MEQENINTLEQEVSRLHRSAMTHVHNMLISDDEDEIMLHLEAALDELRQMGDKELLYVRARKARPKLRSPFLK